MKGDTLVIIPAKVIAFRMARLGLIDPPSPITLTFSVTNLCQSRCKTCNIWRLYHEHPDRRYKELTLDEIEKIFRSLGKVFFFNVSGGEPFLRNDLPDIFDRAMEYLRPRILHIPTNGIAVDRIEIFTRRILESMRQRRYKAPLTIKPSLDGVGKQHDEIRGVKGNWERLLETVKRLKALAQEFPNLHVELGTVVSNFNKRNLDEIEAFAHSLGVESYRNEIAEQREEFFNIGDHITPTGEEYAELMKGFAEKIRKSLKKKRLLARVTESLRLVYYELAARIVLEQRQVIPCYAGISNVHLTPYGDLWPCCVLGYAKPLGNVREMNYNFWSVWHSEEASKVRQSIKNTECACPLANQAYSNIISHTPSLLRVIMNIARYSI
jgi:MoaA/NifB/PqqE/SkfB family radical SAM enzyme